tara:strand:+ start:558 stop:980 length:423 start_codon:yes stop_codon:yes gene_type:complete
MVEHWGRKAGSPSSLPTWVKHAQKLFPDVDHFAEIRLAMMWEVEMPSREKKNVRMFMSRWFKRAQESAEKKGKGSVVVSIDSARWLRRNNKKPELKLARWMEGRGLLSEELIEKYCSYYGVPTPDDMDSVVSIYNVKRGA